jgi:hypothetical protein
VALLTIDGDKVTYDKRDLPTGLFPYNVVVSPDGKIAMTADNGNHGTWRWRPPCSPGSPDRRRTP